MNVLSRSLLCGALLSGVALCAVTDNSAQNDSKQSNSSQKAAANNGEKLFQVHCNRCHNAPEEIRPKAVRAVIMHMRVRAILSTNEERELVEYLNPGGKTP